jgi:hypothetical protein
MKGPSWEFRLGLSLLMASAVIYLIHYLIFKDLHHIFIYGIGHLAFLPIEVLLVTVIIHKLLGEREKGLRLEKLNMVIGAFFSEVGTDLLAYFSDLDPKLEEIKGGLAVSDDWSKEKFAGCCGTMKNYDYDIEVGRVNLENLQKFLLRKRNFLLRLLENPNLLEHETFTDLLQAVFHLTEELAHRESIAGVSDKDLEHLAGDLKRVYGLLIFEWLTYMEHLKSEYPYLFSLAMRMNPFDKESSPEFK